MDWKDKLAEAKKLYDAATAIVSNKDAPAEEKDKVQGMLEDAKRLRTEAGQLKEIAQFGAELAGQAEKQQGPDEEKGRPTQPGEFKEWGEFLKASWKALHPKADIRADDRRLVSFKEKPSAYESKQMVESVGASGGFLVPTEFQTQLQAISGENSIIRNRATIIRMRRRSIQLPVLDQTGTTAGVPHWFGGMQAYWAEEAAQKTYTEAAFRQVELVAHKLIMYTRASDELLDDSAISLSDFLSGPMGFGGAISWYEDLAFLRGTGAGQPLGIIPAPATIHVARAVAGAIGFADLANMMEHFLPSGRGVWFISQSAMSEMIQLNGPAGNPSYIWQPNARDGVPGTILGLPVIWTEKCPLLGQAGDVVLADCRYYLVGDRQATTIESTQYDYWRYDQTSWRAVHRVDGQPWLSNWLTYEDGTTTVSPFVILDGSVAT